MRFNKIFLILLFILSEFLYSQVDPRIQLYRNEPKGNILYRRESTMDGNLVRTLYQNNGEIGHWPYQPSGEWPKGSGHSYLDGVCMLVAAEVKAPGNDQVIHPLVSSYREWMHSDPVTGEKWGWEPVPGYVNPSLTKVAMSIDPSSWPEKWPAALGLTADWDGFWYGYFGKGVMNADFETFFVMDDSKDGTWSRAPYSYYPIKSDLGRGGLGLRVEVRAFQWTHVLAEDCIFWHYDIVNLSDTSYDNALFGFYSDPGVGGSNDSQDDCASFIKEISLAYAYDNNGLGAPIAWKTGYFGYAYLESPGNPWNGIDDDYDNMIDERRDNDIDDDHDWIPFSDLNGNGKWDPGEPLNDDLGKDGIGPMDPGYSGPDEGEGDGKPTHGEPNFDETDKDESDQIGLTSMSIYRLGDGGTGGGWPKDDEPMWKRMSYQHWDTLVQNSNISMVFASGPFPLKKAKRERYSMAYLFGSDLDDLLFNKRTVQEIYNANYNFSKPPLKPILTAVPGDGKVFLYWDNKSESSTNRFLGYQNNDPTQGYKRDFEGYLLYRSQEAEFNDIKLITDSKGEPKYWKPIAQWDLKDSISGPDPVGINGAHFWRGDNTGLQHSYVDKDVKNGTRYYYALVSYNMGDPNYGTTGLQPTECTKIISEDYAGTLKFIDINCAVITPNSPAAGYIPPELTGNFNQVTQGSGTGKININVLNPSSIKNGANYKIRFNATGTIPFYKTSTYDVIRISDGKTDTIINKASALDFGLDKFSQPFDGMAFSFKNDTTVSVVDTSTGWLVGKSNLNLAVVPDKTSNNSIAWPSDYEIKFYDTKQFDTPFFSLPAFFKVRNLTTNTDATAEIFDTDGSGGLSAGDAIVIIEYIGTQFKLTWDIGFMPPFNPGTKPVMPLSGDRFIIKTTKPFNSGDYFSFTTKAASVESKLAKDQFSKISVVPNPYICSAKWERRTLYQTGRGDRKIDFIHLPNKCTVKIYNMAGALVKTLNKDSQAGDGSLSWDLVSDDGMEIAYGIYIYYVHSEGIGEHIGKFAVIK
jgi:hypothetical protein